MAEVFLFGKVLNNSLQQVWFGLHVKCLWRCDDTASCPYHGRLHDLPACSDSAENEIQLGLGSGLNEGIWKILEPFDLSGLHLVWMVELQRLLRSRLPKDSWHILFFCHLQRNRLLWVLYKSVHPRTWAWCKVSQLLERHLRWCEAGVLPHQVAWDEPQQVLASTRAGLVFVLQRIPRSCALL